MTPLQRGVMNGLIIVTPFWLVVMSAFCGSK